MIQELQAIEDKYRQLFEMESDALAVPNGTHPSRRDAKPHV